MFPSRGDIHWSDFRSGAAVHIELDLVDCQRCCYGLVVLHGFEQSYVDSDCPSGQYPAFGISTDCDSIRAHDSTQHDLVSRLILYDDVGAFSVSGYLYRHPGFAVVGDVTDRRRIGLVDWHCCEAEDHGKDRNGQGQRRFLDTVQDITFSIRSRESVPLWSW